MFEEEVQWLWDLRMGSGRRCLEFHNFRLGPDCQMLLQKHWDLSSRYPDVDIQKAEYEFRIQVE